MKLHLSATGCHLPYGITPSLKASQRPVLDLPTQGGGRLCSPR